MEVTAIMEVREQVLSPLSPPFVDFHFFSLFPYNSVFIYHLHFASLLQAMVPQTITQVMALE